MDLKNKKVTVVGLGRSGLAACELLLKKGARVSATDFFDTSELRANARKLRAAVDVEIGTHTEGKIEGRDLLVVSPGVPLDSAPISWARKKGIPVIAEIELAFAFCPAPIIAITGTNGKTTVTTLVGEIFKAAGRKCVVCGNIGSPFSAEVENITSEHTVALEISSFQLQTIEEFKPKVAVILNLTADHLNRHSSFNEYVAAKCRIFLNQDEQDWALLNADSHQDTLAQNTRARVLYFSKDKYSGRQFRNFNSNHYAALSISSLFDIPQEVVISTLRRFKGIEHRLEQVAEIAGVEFINDSKATNVDSTLWALDSIKKPIILIAGGRDKGSDFASAREKIGNRVRAMVLLGEAKGKIEEAFRGLVKMQSTDTLAQAVSVASALACSGDCVLLSPMCASFDMFTDYEQRGKLFKQVVHSLHA